MGDFDYSLIDEFRSRPCLYDRNSSKFKDKVYTAQQWQEISNRLGYDVSILKDRMLQLRNRYNLEKRRIETVRETSPHLLVTSPWKLYDCLSFLSDHIKARRRYKNMLPLGGGRHKEEDMDYSMQVPFNDFSVLGTDDAALVEATHNDTARFGAGNSVQPANHFNHQPQPFPDAMLAVKVEEYMSNPASEETDFNESEKNFFGGDKSNVQSSTATAQPGDGPEKNEKKQQVAEMQQQMQQRLLQKQQQQQQQQQLQQQHQQQLQRHQQHMAMRQKAQLHTQQQIKQHYPQQPNHSTPNSNGILKTTLGGGSGGNDPENLLRLRRRALPMSRLPTNDTSTSYNDNDSNHPPRRMPSAVNRPKPYKPLTRREVKYHIFGQFVASCLRDLPKDMALELVEKFTSETVKSLNMKDDR